LCNVSALVHTETKFPICTCSGNFIRLGTPPIYTQHLYITDLQANYEARKQKGKRRNKSSPLLQRLGST
jgi:hypothetical protein